MSRVVGLNDLHVHMECRAWAKDSRISFLALTNLVMLRQGNTLRYATNWEEITDEKGASLYPMITLVSAANIPYSLL